MRRGLPVVVVAIAAMAAAASIAARTVSYGGIGATVSSFYAQHPHGSGAPPLGVAYYHVDGTRAGRVTAFHVVVNAKPAFASIELVGLVLGISVPLDTTDVRYWNGRCAVYKSRWLARAVGQPYAVVTASRSEQMAWLRTSRSATC